MIYFVGSFAMSRYALFVERRLNMPRGLRQGRASSDHEQTQTTGQTSPRSGLDIRTTRNEVAVEIVGLNKWFGSFHVLRDIDLKVMRGERIVICGPSGSGKSTLLRCINRIEDWQRGRVVVDGIELTDDLKSIDEVRARGRHGVPAVQPVPASDGARELHAGADLGAQDAARTTPRRSRGIICGACAFPSRRTNIRPSSPAASSSGWRSRGRCACSRRSCCSTSRPPRSIRRWSRRCSTPWSALALDGMTMLVVSHEMGFARQVANRMVLMDAGQIIEANEPDAFFNHPQHDRTKLFLSQILR